MYNEDEVLHSTCKCYSAEHTLRWSYDPSEKEFYTEVFLSQYRNVFQRIWVAIKYVFGYKCRYGHWDCTLLSKEEAIKLRDFLHKHVSEPVSRENLSRLN